MKTIRRNVFETNSSSTHSISVDMNSDLLDTLPVDDTGNVTIYPGKFGWQEETHNDAATKASYCLTYCLNYDRSKVDMLRSVIEDQTGATVVFASLDSPWCTHGYIDHQSQDVAQGAFESDATLRMFIFNRNSVLTLDNDNH